MRLFRKKEESDSSGKKRGRPKKDKKKPWGRQERFFVFFVLVGTVLASSFFALSARAWKLPGLPRFSWPALGLSETFTFESQKSITSTDFSEIKNVFRQETKDLSGVYGFAVLRLQTGETYGLYEDEVFQAASLIKLPLMLSLMREKPEGYRDLVWAMGQRSDNQAFRNAREILGDRLIQEAILGVGMVNTSLAENETTASDMILLFEKLWTGELLPEQESEFIFDSLTKTIYEEHLAAGIPENIRVAHKYGREVHVVADGGVVFSEEPFVLVILTKGVVESEADAVFPELSRLIYDFESQN